MGRQEFTLSKERLDLPKGAWARALRKTLRRRGQAVLGLTQGRQRCYVYPLYTPAGFAVTSESPADHPHHNSFWIAADHLHCRMPVADGKWEEYTYNFYVDEIFQGRAPGRLIEIDSRLAAQGPEGCRIEQEIEWRGPVEWAAPAGRLSAVEQRTLTLSVEDRCHVIDVESRLQAREFDFSLGPTRHAYFNLRVAESMSVANGGTVRDDRGQAGGSNVAGADAKWVCYEGPVGGGHRAGAAVFPHPADHSDLSWFVTDWGVITVGPFRLNGMVVLRGEALVARYRVIVFDGEMEAEEVAERFSQYVKESA